MGVRSKLPYATKVGHVAERETVVVQASSAQLLESIATLIGS